jgi:hypothetical protein
MIEALPESKRLETMKELINAYALACPLNLAPQARHLDPTSQFRWVV